MSLQEHQRKQQQRDLHARPIDYDHGRLFIIHLFSY